jgi:ABC-type multidrug transport system ATPase subunit
MSETLIEARNLAKSFHDRTVAINDLDLAVKRGMVYGLIGRNGSGKTTALRLLLGLLRPDSGEARILGWNFWRAPHDVRSRVAYVCQSQCLPESLSLEQLDWCLKRYHQRWDTAYARQMAEKWSLPWQRPLGSLSGGRQRQAAVLLALAGRPEVIILDEPAAGLDPVARRELIDGIVEALTQSDGCTVLLSTHLIGDLERLASHIGILNRGRMALSLSLENLLQQFKRVQVICDDDELAAQLAVPGTVAVARRTGAVLNAIVRWTHNGELDALRATADIRVQVFPMGLEEIFLELFGDLPTEPNLFESPDSKKGWG